MEILLLDPFSNSSVQNDIKWVKPLKFVGLAVIPNSAIQDCSKTLEHGMKFISNFSSSQNTSFRIWKKAATASLLTTIGLKLFLIIFLSC
jgi:hypothetical protein